MITIYGSQRREPIADTDYVVIPGTHRQTGEVILFDTFECIYELWIAHDDFAGYTIDIDGTGYEYCRTVTKGE